MRTNTLKQKLRDGKPVFGVMLTFPAPPIVEMLGYMGFDWVLLDNEHGSITVDTAEDVIRAAELTGIAPIVRPVANRPEMIAPFLDRGAWGVQVPHVNTSTATWEVCCKAPGKRISRPCGKPRGRARVLSGLSPEVPPDLRLVQNARIPGKLSGISCRWPASSYQ